MKQLLLSILLSVFLISSVNAEQKGVLNEGYHFPGGGYSQPASTQPVQSQGVDAQIAEAKNNYDTCMRNIKGEFSNDLVKNAEIMMKRNQCQRYMDIYENLLYSKHNVVKNSNNSKDKNNTHSKAVDKVGTYYYKNKSGNFVNTKNGAVMIHQTGDLYLNTITGKVINLILLE